MPLFKFSTKFFILILTETVRLAKFATSTVKDVYVNQEVRACGIGTTRNFPNFPKKLQCVDLKVVPIAKCDGIQDKTFCTLQSQSDKNVSLNKLIAVKFR